jgi:hypothetical protein
VCRLNGFWALVVSDPIIGCAFTAFEGSVTESGRHTAVGRYNLDALCLAWHIQAVVWEVEGTDEFAEWFATLSDEEQVSVGRVVDLLVEHGPSLPFP